MKLLSANTKFISSASVLIWLVEVVHLIVDMSHSFLFLVVRCLMCVNNHRVNIN